MSPSLNISFILLSNTFSTSASSQPFHTQFHIQRTDLVDIFPEHLHNLAYIFGFLHLLEDLWVSYHPSVIAYYLVFLSVMNHFHFFLSNTWRSCLTELFSEFRRTAFSIEIFFKNF